MTVTRLDGYKMAVYMTMCQIVTNKISRMYTLCHVG